MNDEKKETFRIEISRFTPEETRPNENKDNFSEKDTMKISIERQKTNASKFSYNVNVDNDTDDKIRIKIEKKDKRSRNKDSKEKGQKSSKDKMTLNTNYSNKNSNNEHAKSGPVAIRKDVYGNIIKKGGKKHKVTFIDSATNNKKRFDNIQEVESYKAFNVDVSVNVPSNKTKEHNKSECCQKCIIY